VGRDGIRDEGRRADDAGRSGPVDGNVRVVVGGTTVEGRAIDLADGTLRVATGRGAPGAGGVTVATGAADADSASGAEDADGAVDELPIDAPAAATVVDAVRAAGPVDGVRVDCPEPGSAFAHVGSLHPDLALSVRGALAAAARSRGHEPPEADALASARAELASQDVPTVDLAAVERRVAEAGDRERELRERVAALRGRVQALRGTTVEGESSVDGELSTAGADQSRRLSGDDGASSPADPVAEAEADYREAVRELTEAETERIAAEQRLEGLRDRLRGARDARRRRLELQDRVANLERAARESLAGAVYEEFAAAVATMPGAGDPGEAPGEFDGDPVTAALAVARVADLDAPVVDATGRFPDAATAAKRLDAAVIRV
jgi:hypothetical protein